MAEKIFHIVLVILVACIFIACVAGVVYAIKWNIDNEANRITEGVVIDKDYDPARVSSSYTKETGAHTHYYPERYRLLLEGRKDGESVQYWKEVTAEEYAAHNIGDYYGKH